MSDLSKSKFKLEFERVFLPEIKNEFKYHIHFDNKLDREIKVDVVKSKGSKDSLFLAFKYPTYNFNKSVDKNTLISKTRKVLYSIIGDNANIRVYNDYGKDVKGWHMWGVELFFPITSDTEDTIAKRKPDPDYDIPDESDSNDFKDSKDIYYKVHTSDEHKEGERGMPGSYYGYANIYHPILGEFTVSVSVCRRRDCRIDGKPWNFLQEKEYILTEDQKEFILRNQKEIADIGFRSIVSKTLKDDYEGYNLRDSKNSYIEIEEDDLKSIYGRDYDEVLPKKYPTLNVSNKYTASLWTTRIVGSREDLQKFIDDYNWLFEGKLKITDCKRISDMDWYFGKEEAEEYGDKVRRSLKGKTVSKRRDLGDQPGGLVYEAEKLGMDKFVLLRTLEGLCYQGHCEEIDDSTYKILDSKPSKIKKVRDYSLPYALWVRKNGKWLAYCSVHSKDEVDKKEYLKLGYEDVIVVENGVDPNDTKKFVVYNGDDQCFGRFLTREDAKRQIEECKEFDKRHNNPFKEIYRIEIEDSKFKDNENENVVFFSNSLTESDFNFIAIHSVDYNMKKEGVYFILRSEDVNKVKSPKMEITLREFNKRLNDSKTKIKDAYGVGGVKMWFEDFLMNEGSYSEDYKKCYTLMKEFYNNMVKDFKRCETVEDTEKVLDNCSELYDKLYDKVNSTAEEKYIGVFDLLQYLEEAMGDLQDKFSERLSKY